MRDVVLGNRAVFGSVNSDPGLFEGAVAALGRFRERWPEAVDGGIAHSFRPEEAPAAMTVDDPRAHREGRGPVAVTGGAAALRDRHPGC